MQTKPPPPTDAGPPAVWSSLVRALRRARRPIERFFQIEAASGVLLLIAASVALAAASSPWGAAYTSFWHAPITLRVGPFVLARGLEWFVNDALMVLFFFVAGLEIRREIHAGELSSWQSAALPATAALGGMLAPAGLYLLLAGAPSTRHGWGVPMATDIAFAMGVLSLLGRRVPASLRVLLLALAIIDDIGAIVVIALFYSTNVSFAGLGGAAAAVLAIVLMQRAGIRSRLAYAAPAIVLWGGVAAAGVHPTIAGVIVGLLTPVRGEPSPANELLDTLHPWVAFGIMPVFALANAGVVLSLPPSGNATAPVLSGVFAGLVVGKPLGILLASFLALRLGLAKLPNGLGARHLVVLGLIAGVGFTMSLLLAQLAFRDPAALATAKVGVLVASAAAALLALVAGTILLPLPPPTPTEEDEATVG